MARKQLNVRMTEADSAILARLRERTGLDPTGIIRLALRELDARGLTERRQTMKCLICNTECGTLATPMHYLFRLSQDGRRDDVAPFCSASCTQKYVDAHQVETATVPRCSVCGEIIVNAPWYPNLADRRPRHYECTPGAAQQD